MRATAAGRQQTGESGELAVGRLAGHDYRWRSHASGVKDSCDFASVARHRGGNGATTWRLVHFDLLMGKRKEFYVNITFAMRYTLYYLFNTQQHLGDTRKESHIFDVHRELFARHSTHTFHLIAHIIIHRKLCWKLIARLLGISHTWVSCKLLVPCLTRRIAS